MGPGRRPTRHGVKPPAHLHISEPKLYSISEVVEGERRRLQWLQVIHYLRLLAKRPCGS